MRIVFWVAFWVFLLDQATKYLVVHLLDLRTLGRIDVWPPFLNLRMAWNTGINFGLLSNDSAFGRWILVAVALAITGAVLWWLHAERAGRLHRIAAGVLIGGALGNVVDRLIYGAVADFLNMSCCGIDNPFAFNVADAAIFAGAIALVLLPTGKKPS